MDIIPIGLVHCFLLFLVIHNCVGPPTKNKEPGNSSKTNDSKTNLDDLGLEYNRYLTEVVNALESDPEFRKKLETAGEADFRNGKIAAELEYVNHHVRTKLDEIKRIELQRLRDYVKQAEEIEKNEANPNHINPGHVDHSNPHTFESADLHKLIMQVRQDLAEADKERRSEFKEYELQKKFEQEQKIKAMDEEHKKQYLHELEEQKKKHQQHDPLHHPGSKAQLEEVWEKEDHMGNQKFNPKTFFLLHDINGDGYWDEDEVKALFVKELDKLYQAGVPEDDMREREEEMERMREHVFKESDTNGDRFISYQEFLEQTKKQEFNRDEGWETVDTQTHYSQNEYEEFERRRQEEIQRLIDQGLLQPYAPDMMHPPAPGYAPHPGQFQQQYGHPGGMNPNHIPPPQYGHPQGYHPQAVPQPHQQGVPQPHQQGVPQHPQAVPQHPQAVPQHPQAVPQHPQAVPHHSQGAPVQGQYPPQGQYGGQQQYGGQYPNQGSAQSSHQVNQLPQPHGQVPVQNSNHIPQENPSAAKLDEAAAAAAKNAPQYNNQQNIGQINQGLNQAQHSSNLPQASQQQYHHDPNQIVPNPNPSANQQIPPNNQQYNNQAQHIPQHPNQVYGSAPKPGAAQNEHGGIENNQIHSDTNSNNNNIPKH